MRILCVTPWFPAFPGAQSGNFIHDSVIALQAQGHSVKVLVAQPWHPGWGGLLHHDWGRPQLRPDAHDPNLGLEHLGHLSIPRNYLRGFSDRLCEWRVRPAIERAAQSFKPDVILAHTELIGRAAVAARSTTGVPVVIILHGIDTTPRVNTPKQLRAVGKVLSAADRVVMVGEPLRQYFSPIVGRSDHFRIVHNGFFLPLDATTVKRGAWGLPLRFISVSNLHEGKGIDLNLQAFCKLQERGQYDWTYTVVGDGRERASLETMAQALGIAGQVKFAGAVEHGAVHGYLALADVFVLPSYREAFGVAYLEAMACGLLTVGVRGQGPSAFIRNGETGLLVAPKDVDSLAAALVKAFENPSIMQSIASKGRDIVQSEFTWQRHAEKMTCMLGEIASSKPLVTQL